MRVKQATRGWEDLDRENFKTDVLYRIREGTDELSDWDGRGEEVPGEGRSKWRL